MTALAITLTAAAAITGRALFDMNPIGATVEFSDGTPRPPERFNKKLSAWKNKNGSGVFGGSKPRDPRHEWSHDSFMIQTHDMPHFVSNVHFMADDGKTFTVTPPEPGTILMLSVYNEREPELKHRFANEAAAYAWGTRGGYSLLKQTEYGSAYKIVQPDGTLADWTPAS